MDYPVPDNDRERVRALDAYHLAGTPPEADFDEIAELAAYICGCPIAVVNLIAEKWEWYKGKCGVPENVNGEPRGGFCTWTICSNDMLIVPDMTRHPEFAGHDQVKGQPHFRFYAGAPLINPEGYVLGTLCVLDHRPREIEPEQIVALRRLTRQAVAQMELRRRFAELDEAHRALAEERQKAEDLLVNILPHEIAEELKAAGHVRPRYCDAATILFTDFKGFTRLAERMEPRALIEALDGHFSAFDDIVAHHGLEKLKTIGDAYMAVAGLPRRNDRHAEAACAAALEIRDHMARANAARGKIGLPAWDIRIGLHSGGVIAGVVGRKRFTYDIWGDAVNVAALMEAHAEPGQILVSESTSGLVRGEFELSPRGEIDTAKKGPVRCFTLVGGKP